jgi:lactate permease
MVNVPIGPSAEELPGIFIQELAPIRGSLVGSFFVGLIPLILVLILLGVFKVPAHYASFSGLVIWLAIFLFSICL